MLDSKYFHTHYEHLGWSMSREPSLICCQPRKVG